MTCKRPFPLSQRGGKRPLPIGSVRHPHEIPVSHKEHSKIAFFVARSMPNTEPPKASRGSMIYTSGTTGRPKGVRRQPSSPEVQAASEAIDAAVSRENPTSTNFAAIAAGDRSL